MILATNKPERKHTMHTEHTLKQPVIMNKQGYPAQAFANIKTIMILMCLSAFVFMTSCKTPSVTGAKPDAPIEQPPSVFAATLPLLLDYIAAQRGDWTYDKIAGILSIDHFDNISSWKASWENRDDSPFEEGAICKDLTKPDAEKSLFIAGCYVNINKNNPLSLDQYAQLFGIERSRIEKTLADDDSFIESRYKTVSIRGRIDKGYVISIVMSYEPR